MALVAGCGGASPLEASCAEVVTEELDPGWTVHLLPGAPMPEFVTDPPTSGTHYSADPVTGALDQPLDPAAQVTILEVGGVLLQYRPADVGDDELGRLERLATDDVVVAPNPDLPDPVVATAWVTKQRCQGVDLDTLSAFAEEYLGSGPEGSG